MRPCPEWAIGTTSFATRRYGTSISGVLTRSVWCRAGSASTSIASGTSCPQTPRGSMKIRGNTLLLCTHGRMRCTMPSSSLEYSARTPPTTRRCSPRAGRSPSRCLPSVPRSFSARVWPMRCGSPPATSRAASYPTPGTGSWRRIHRPPSSWLQISSPSSLEVMANVTLTTRPPLPPFTRESAIQKVRLAEDGWNTREPGKVALAYAIDSRWRNRSEFIAGRSEIIAFLTRKWSLEIDYRLIKELWAFGENRIAVRFAYEWHDDSSHWYRSYGNENWEFDGDGLMKLRFASINDFPILESDRKYHWPLGRRPDDHPGLSDLGL